MHNLILCSYLVLQLSSMLTYSCTINTSAHQLNPNAFQPNTTIGSSVKFFFFWGGERKRYKNCAFSLHMAGEKYNS